ncbi:MAG: alpha/beta hydrolase [Bacteroidales bacterium]|nr:alpha/beta hydrolase [Bacteroidales bacterium]
MKINILLGTVLMMAIFGPKAYSQTEVSFTNSADGAVLSGTLLTPKDVENPPVVLMVTGSGLQDRDEELLGHKPFKVIAEYLAERGIASLRYDDRGFGKSTGSIEGVTTETFKQDAIAGIDFLRSQGGGDLPKFSKIGVLGHSEGGTIAFLIAAEGKADFIVSLAGGATQGKEAVLTQNYNALKAQGIPSEQIGQVVDAVEEVFDKLIASPEDEPVSVSLQRIASESQSPEIAQTLALQMGNDSNGKWYKYFLTLDPSDAISKITCPVMAVNGTKDFQVDCQENLGNIRKRLPESPKNLIKSYEGLNHLFQNCNTGYPTEYATIKEDIAEQVLSDISNWIKSL